MTSPSAEKMTAALDAFFDWIEAKQTFIDLGLTVFRGYDGRTLPVKEDGSINGNDLPALYAESFTPEVEDQDTTPYTETVTIQIVGGIVFANTAIHLSHSATMCSQALMALNDIILNREAIDTNLGTGPGGAIDDYTFEITGMDPVRSTANPMEVLYWDGQFKAGLTFVRSLPESIA